MKQITILLLLLNLGFIAVAQNGDQFKFDSRIKIGKSDLAQKVLDVWKDWEDNLLTRHADHFSDTLTAYFSQGGFVKGKESFMKSGAEYRSKFSKVKSTIFAITPLRRDDLNEDVVAIWGMDESTSTDGKTEVAHIHEVWWFNQDGKIIEMRQWEAKPTSSK